MNAKYSLTPIFLAKALPPCFLEKCNRILYFREEKSLRHVVMVATWRKPKTSLILRVNSHCFYLIQFHWICQMLAGEIELNPKGPYISLEKEKKPFVWNEEVSCRSHATTAKKRTKRRDARAECKEMPLPTSFLKLPVVVIKKFCYHGNVKSHLLRKEGWRITASLRRY